VLFEDEYAVIYRDGGKVGGAVAFACEGAKVVLTGRTLESLEELAEEIGPSNKPNR
jgi:NADP-dependent 3-hydroxy acid dehydrogenase YdfG